MINSVIAGLFLLHLELSYLLLMRQPLFVRQRGICVKNLLPGTELQGLAGRGEQTAPCESRAALGGGGEFV